jgi:TPP-dependent 2-oxoacid decarboxylase
MYPLPSVTEQVDLADPLIRLCIQHHELNTRSAASGLKGPHVVDLQPASASIGGFHYPQVALRDVLTRLGTWVSGREFAPAPSRPPAVAVPFEPKPSRTGTMPARLRRRPGEPVPSMSDTTSCKAGAIISSLLCSPRRRTRWAFG